MKMRQREQSCLTERRKRVRAFRKLATYQVLIVFSHLHVVALAIVAGVISSDLIQHSGVSYLRVLQLLPGLVSLVAALVVPGISVLDRQAGHLEMLLTTRISPFSLFAIRWGFLMAYFCAGVALCLGLTEARIPGIASPALFLSTMIPTVFLSLVGCLGAALGQNIAWGIIPATSLWAVSTLLRPAATSMPLAIRTLLVPDSAYYQPVRPLGVALNVFLVVIVVQAIRWAMSRQDIMLS